MCIDSPRARHPERLPRSSIASWPVRVPYHLDPIVPFLEKYRMKIAIPLADGRLCMHFGHCEQFALVDVDGTSGKPCQTALLTPPPHEPGLLPRWLHEQGATVIIAGGMGQRAQQLFAQSGVVVVVGAPSDVPENLVEAYLNGTLVSGQNACDH
jgi:ATP-binding protein involved in chromosome partitioning